jgi:PEGA domain
MGGGHGGGMGGGMGGGHGGGWGHGGWGGWGGWGHGFHGNHFFFGPRFVVGGGFLYGSPFYWGPYYWGYPYYGYGYYPYYGYPPYWYPPYDASVPSYPSYPPPATQGAPDQSAIPPGGGMDQGYGAAPPPDQGYVADSSVAAGDDYSSYGLIQLRGVPDGASIDLDGRHWLDGRNLGDRWLALPAGAHTISVRAEGYETFERSIDVTAGRNQVVRIGPLRLHSG